MTTPTHSQPNDARAAAFADFESAKAAYKAAIGHAVAARNTYEALCSDKAAAAIVGTIATAGAIATAVYGARDVAALALVAAGAALDAFDALNDQASTHTPGPYAVSHGDVTRIIVKGTAQVVAGVHRRGFNLGWHNAAQTRATAYVLAAAPEMLIACREAAQALLDVPGTEQTRGRLLIAIAQAEAGQ